MKWFPEFARCTAKFFIILFLFAFWSLHQGYSQIWVQKGADLIGNIAGDEFGKEVDISVDGSIIAISAPYEHSNSMVDNGMIRIFAWNGEEWSQMGSSIYGDLSNCKFGKALSLSGDGQTLAVGAQNYSSGGIVKIYRWNGTDWVQLGDSFLGAQSHSLGSSVHLNNDGSVLAIGSTFADGVIQNCGGVDVFIWNGTDWVQKGQSLYGETASETFGSKVFLSNDGNVLAIAAEAKSDFASLAGYACVYEWNGSIWTQRGSEFVGQASDRRLGGDLALSADGNTFVVSAPQSGFYHRPYPYTLIYDWNGTNWSLKGDTLECEVHQTFGYGVAVSDDGNTVAIGGEGYSGIAASAGQVRIYHWNESEWILKGNRIDGIQNYDCLGADLSMTADGGRIIVSAPEDYFTKKHKGRVEVYDYCIHTTSDITVVACDTFIAPDGAKYIESGQYQAIIANSKGCDSVISIDLTIHESYQVWDSISACDSYYWEVNSATYDSSGIYLATFSSENDCDSIHFLYLTINKSYEMVEEVRACNNYIWADKGLTYTQSGTYYDTLKSISGCDSVRILNLTINENFQINESITSCDSFFWDLSQETYRISGVYKDTLSTIDGCDSIIVLNLAINSSSTHTIDTMACYNFTAADGTTYNKSGNYSATILNHLGCDSLITYNLSIVNIDSTLILTDDALTASEIDGRYIWKNCITGEVLSDETLRIFKPQHSGTFSVEITKGKCSVETQCKQFNLVNSNILFTDQGIINLYPNPADGELTVNLGVQLEYIKVDVYGIDGSVIKSVEFFNQQVIELEIGNIPGLYFIQVGSERLGSITFKVLNR